MTAKKSALKAVTFKSADQMNQTHHTTIDTDYIHTDHLTPAERRQYEQEAQDAFDEGFSMAHGGC